MLMIATLVQQRSRGFLVKANIKLNNLISSQSSDLYYITLLAYLSLSLQKNTKSTWNPMNNMILIQKRVHFFKEKTITNLIAVKSLILCLRKSPKISFVIWISRKKGTAWISWANFHVSEHAVCAIKFFSSMRIDLSYCYHIPGLMNKLDLSYKLLTVNWPFEDKSKSGSVDYAVNMKDMYEKMRILLQKIKYKDHNWNICVDLKVVTLLTKL